MIGGIFWLLRPLSARNRHLKLASALEGAVQLLEALSIESLRQSEREGGTD